MNKLLIDNFVTVLIMSVFVSIISTVLYNWLKDRMKKIDAEKQINEVDNLIIGMVRCSNNIAASASELRHYTRDNEAQKILEKVIELNNKNELQLRRYSRIKYNWEMKKNPFPVK